tara:strand:- start:363 stop:560 length:198 start_codon:yes stop_codon:yes gene_type:complete
VIFISNITHRQFAHAHWLRIGADNILEPIINRFDGMIVPAQIVCRRPIIMIRWLSMMIDKRIDRA